MISLLRHTALLALALGSTPAFAHAHLTSAVPALDGTVSASPTALDLDFSEGVNLRFTGVSVTGPDKAAVPTGPATLGAGDGTRLVVPLRAPLAAGTYRVDWHALATDGHKTTGSYTFTVKP